MRSILLLIPRDNRCMYLAHVCCSNCVGVCGNVCCLAAVVKDSGVLVLECMLYVCVRHVMECVFCLYCDEWSCRCACM